MTSGGGAVGGEIFVNIRTDGGTGGGGGVPGAGGTPRPAGGGAPPKDPAMSMLNADQKKQLEQAREEKKALKEYQDFQKLKNKEGQNDLLNELQRGRRQATMVAGAVTTGMLARNSKIMATATGALTQLFGAFIDVFLMPFIPLIIPVLKYIAELLPKWMEWTQKFADLFAKDPMAALAMAGRALLDKIGDFGIAIGKLFGFSEEEVRQFYADTWEKAKNTWEGVKDAWAASSEYIKGVWEESGGSVWGSIKIMAGDAWQLAKDSAEAAWDAFASWQPGVASAITSAWSGAANYVKKVWEESGCSVMGSIGIVGKDAMNGIGSVGKWAWRQFAAWQPGVAASIESAWCAAAGFITNTWTSGGRNIVAFFEGVARDVGQHLLNGLSWLWDEDGGGLKQKLFAVLDAMQNWVYEKTGLGGSSAPRIVAGTQRTTSGNLIPLSDWRAASRGAENTGGGYSRPPGWQEDMGWGNQGGVGRRFANLGRQFGEKLGIDSAQYERTKSQQAYEQYLEMTSLPSHIAQLEARGDSTSQQIATYIENVMMGSYQNRFSDVTLSEKNGKWDIDVTIRESFLPDDKIDGMRIS